MSASAHLESTEATLRVTAGKPASPWLRPLVEEILRDSGCPSSDKKTPVGFIDFDELCERVPLSQRTLRAQIKKRRIPFIKIPGGRRLLFHWASVEKSLVRFQVGGVIE